MSFINTRGKHNLTSQGPTTNIFALNILSPQRLERAAMQQFNSLLVAKGIEITRQPCDYRVRAIVNTCRLAACLKF